MEGLHERGKDAMYGPRQNIGWCRPEGRAWRLGRAEFHPAPDMAPWHGTYRYQGWVLFGASPVPALHGISGASGAWDEVLLMAVLFLVVVVLAVLGAVKGKGDKKSK